MSWGLPVRNGLSVGIGSVATLASGSGTGGRSRRGEPTLILDFVGGNVPYGVSLDLSFTGQTYSAYSADAPAPAFANFWVWS